jgi:hypothetical protein
MSENANTRSPWFSVVGRLAQLKRNPHAGFQTINTSANKLGGADVTIRAAAIRADKRISAIPTDHRTELELVVGLSVGDVCLLLRQFRHWSSTLGY